MKMTFVHPDIPPVAPAYRIEPLASAMLSALAPPDVRRMPHDDRFEAIPFDEPIDFVAPSVSLVGANPAHQTAQEYQRRSIPVVMGEYRPSLLPEEALEHGEAMTFERGGDV